MSIAIKNATCDCGKVVYVSRREALVIAKRAKNITKQQRAYRCKAGFWHLTSRPSQSKSHLPEGSKVPDALKLARARRVEKRAAARRLTKKTLEPVVKVAPAPVRKQPVQTGPEHTSCIVCQRRWLSDLDPAGRRCPGCGAVGTIVIGWADRARDYIRAVAA